MADDDLLSADDASHQFGIPKAEAQLALRTISDLQLPYLQRRNGIQAAPYWLWSGLFSNLLGESEDGPSRFLTCVQRLITNPAIQAAAVVGIGVTTGVPQIVLGASWAALNFNGLEYIRNLLLMATKKRVHLERELLDPQKLLFLYWTINRAIFVRARSKMRLIAALTTEGLSGSIEKLDTSEQFINIVAGISRDEMYVLTALWDLASRFTEKSQRPPYQIPIGNRHQSAPEAIHLWLKKRGYMLDQDLVVSYLSRLSGYGLVKTQSQGVSDDLFAVFSGDSQSIEHVIEVYRPTKLAHDLIIHAQEGGYEPIVDLDLPSS